MPCSRAMFVGDAPGAKLCAAIVCFCSVVQRRRRSPRGIKSIRRVGALLRLVVCALSVDAVVPAGVASVSIGGVKHTQPWKSHVGAAQRLRHIFRYLFYSVHAAAQHIRKTGPRADIKNHEVARCSDAQ